MWPALGFSIFVQGDSETSVPGRRAHNIADHLKCDSGIPSRFQSEISIERAQKRELMLGLAKSCGHGAQELIGVAGFKRALGIGQIT